MGELSYDPEDQVSLQDMSNIPVCTDLAAADTYYSFPN